MSENIRTRTYSWTDPKVTAQTGKNMSGLEFFQKILTEKLGVAPIGATMGMSGITEVAEGRIVFAATPAEYHYNPIGVVHGGFALTLLDSAMGCAVHTTLPHGVGYTTLEVKANFVRALTAETGEVYCEGKVIHSGKQIATAEGRIFDKSGKLYAHGTTTCIIFRP
jgi:uncharacterized protein (TIGR00369 family)